MSEQMAMLPNDSHPGRGCSCCECLRNYPDALQASNQQFSPLIYWDRRPAAEAFECRICGAWHGNHLRGCTAPELQAALSRSADEFWAALFEAFAVKTSTEHSETKKGRPG